MNWQVECKTAGSFAITAPFNDGMPGRAVLGSFSYRPHATLASAAPDLLEAVRICIKAESERFRKLKPGSPASAYTAKRLRLLQEAVNKAECIR